MLDGEGDLFLGEVFFFGSSLFRTIFFFLSLVFGSYWLIVTWCIVILLHHLPLECPFGSLRPSPIFFFRFMATIRHESIAVDTLSTLSLERLTLLSSTLPWILVKNDTQMTPVAGKG